MKIVVFTLLALLCSQTIIARSQASPRLRGPIENAEVQNIYEELGRLFANGIRPNPEQMENRFWAGRCFESESPNEPHNIALIVQKIQPSAGPIDRTAHYEALSFWALNYASSLLRDPDFFDSKNLAVLQDRYAGDFYFGIGSMSMKKVDLTSTSFIYKAVPFRTASEPDRPAEINEIKSSGDYLIQTITDPSQPSKVLRCYYFIQKHLDAVVKNKRKNPNY